MIKRIALALSILTAAPAAAFACMNAMYLSGDEAVKQVQRAEKLLAQGKLDQASRLVRPYRYEYDNKDLDQRAHLVWAATHFRRNHTKQHADQLKYLVESIERMNKENEDNPRIVARLAEGYAQFGDRGKEGLKLLQDLHERDLVPSAHDYATLASLHGRYGDSKDGDLAIKRCKAMTKNKSICKVRVVGHHSFDESEAQGTPQPRSRSLPKSKAKPRAKSAKIGAMPFE